VHRTNSLCSLTPPSLPEKTPLSHPVCWNSAQQTRGCWKCFRRPRCPGVPGHDGQEPRPQGLLPLALRAPTSRRSLHLSIASSHVSTCWLCQLWLHPLSFPPSAEAPKQNSYIRFCPTNLSGRRHSQKPVQSTSWPQGTRSKGCGRPSTSRLQRSPQVAGDLDPDSCLPTLLSVRGIPVWTCN